MKNVEGIDREEFMDILLKYEIMMKNIWLNICHARECEDKGKFEEKAREAFQV